MEGRNPIRNEQHDFGKPNDYNFHQGNANYYKASTYNSQGNLNQALDYQFNAGEQSTLNQEFEGAAGLQEQFDYAQTTPINPTFIGQQQEWAKESFHDSTLECEQRNYHKQRQYFLQPPQPLVGKMKNGDDDAVNLNFFNQSLQLNTKSQNNEDVIADADSNNGASNKVKNVSFQLPDTHKPPPLILNENLTDVNDSSMSHSDSGEPGASDQSSDTPRTYENMPLKSWRPPLEFNSLEELKQSELEWEKCGVSNGGHDNYLLEIDHALFGGTKLPRGSSMKEYFKAAENYAIYGNHFFDFMPTTPSLQNPSPPSGLKQHSKPPIRPFNHSKPPPKPFVPNYVTTDIPRRGRLPVFANMTRSYNDSGPTSSTHNQSSAKMSNDAGNGAKSFKFTKDAFPPLGKSKKNKAFSHK